MDRRIRLLELGIDLENRVEIHDLGTGGLIEFLLGKDSKNLLRNALGVRIPVCTRQAKDTSILSDTTEIDSPGIDTDGVDLYA